VSVDRAATFWVIGDIVVEPGQNEITAALAFLKNLPLEGAVITGDAMFCQRETCQAIEDGKGDYLFVVKDNQPELKASIAESFGALSHRGPGRSTARFEDRRNG
jgi:predicted transposase YbfD/YdcC